MALADLEKRVRALELASRAIGRQCLCRAGQRTTYHTAEELKRMMDTRCPVHGLRELGHLRLVPSGLPLRTEDQHLCSCPPSPVREFLQGRRGPLTEAEQAEEERSWERESIAAADENFRRDKACARRLLQKYEYTKCWRGQN